MSRFSCGTLATDKLILVSSAFQKRSFLFNRQSNWHITTPVHTICTVFTRTNLVNLVLSPGHRVHLYFCGVQLSMVKDVNKTHNHFFILELLNVCGFILKEIKRLFQNYISYCSVIPVHKDMSLSNASGSFERALCHHFQWSRVSR